MTGQSTSSEENVPTTQDHEGTTTEHVLGRRISEGPWLARATGVGLSGLSVGFVLLLGVALGQGGKLALITRPLPMRVALALPYLISLFALGTSVGAVLAWWHRYWSLPGRIHQTFLAVLGLGFTWQLAELGLLAL